MATTTTMPKSIKGTRTEQALVNAYMNESQSYSRYMFYSQQAEKKAISRYRRCSRRPL